MNHYSIKNGQLILRVLLQPGARADQIVGIYQDSLKIRLKAPAIEGRANQALIDFMAKQFKVPKKMVTLASGKQSRHKLLIISGVTRIPEWL